MPFTLDTRLTRFANVFSLRSVVKPIQFVCLVAFLFAPWLSSWAADANDPRYWLEKMVRSADKFNYEGTFVYRRNAQLVAMRIMHAADDKGRRERLTSLNGVTREIIREDNSVTAILPDKEREVIDRRRIAKPFASRVLVSIKEVEKYYALTLGNEDRTAGRQTRVILIAPRDQYRYGYRLWVDQETGLLLQSDLLNEHGEVMEQVMFTDIKLLNTPPVVLPESNRGSKAQNPALSNNTAETDSSLWKVNRMPPGFVLTERYHQTHTGYQPGFEHLVYTDGLASVSIFVEKQTGGTNTSFTGISHMGAVNAYGSMLDGRQVTVVGEVPLATVQLIGSSIGRAVTQQPLGGAP